MMQMEDFLPTFAPKGIRLASLKIVDNYFFFGKIFPWISCLWILAFLGSAKKIMKNFLKVG